MSYFLPSNNIEYERLNILHDVFLEPTKKYLNMAGLSKLGKDSLVFDVGCGTGLIVEHIAEGSAAKVLGFDKNENQIIRAKKNQEHKPNTEYKVLDIEQETSINKADIVNVRFLLHHLKKPDEAMDNILSMIIPGGNIIIGEPIMDGRWVYPHNQAYYDIYNLHLENQKDHFWQPNYGKKLLAELSNRNDIEIICSEHFRPILRSQKHKRHHLLVLELFREEFINNGLVTREQADAMKLELEELSLNNKFVTDLFGVVFVLLKKIR